MESRTYRDELAAAQARITELEDEVRRLRQPPAGADDPMLAALEKKQRDWQRAAQPRQGVIAALVLGGFFALVGIALGLVAASDSIGLAATFIVGGLIVGSSLGWLTSWSHARTARIGLDIANRELAEARRLRAVERALLEAPKLRVNSEEPPSEEEAPSEPLAITRQK